jgi:hypothetical protein
MVEPERLIKGSSLFWARFLPYRASTSRGTLLLRVVSQLSVDQYWSAWAHFKALFVFYTFDK